MVYLFAVIFGFSYGGTGTQVLGLVGYFLGMRSLAQMTGIMEGVCVLISSLSPLMAGFIFDKTGSYAIAFVIGAAVCAAVGVIALLIKPPQKAPMSQGLDGQR